jgi:deoxyribose-phosphate aldolase
MATDAKSFETNWCIENGADEIDMVINVGALKDNQMDFVTDDIKAVVKAAKGKTVKVILETCLLSHDEKVKACEASLAAGAHFVKTSTGFSSAGATLDDVTLMKKIVGNKMKVKASGGIKNSDQAKAYIAAGAERLGTSSGIEIIKGLEAKGSY